MSKGDQERRIAQGQAAKFFNIIGYCEKHRDGIKCPQCFCTVLQHTDVGVADYTGAINGRAFCCEVKAGGERFPFSKIRKDQRDWMHWYQGQSKATAWVWLLMGTDRAGSKNTKYPRATFLIDLDMYESIEEDVIKLGKVKSLPLNALAAQSRVATRDNQLYATFLMKRWQLEWQGNQLWWPRQDHPLWSDIGIPFGNSMRLPAREVAA